MVKVNFCTLLKKELIIQYQCSSYLFLSATIRGCFTISQTATHEIDLAIILFSHVVPLAEKLSETSKSVDK